MPDGAKLPIANTLRETVAEVVRARVTLARALLVPATIVALSAVAYRLTLNSDRSSLSAWSSRVALASVMTSSISGLAAILIAVSTHRLVLLGERFLPSRWGVFWSGREFGFLGRTVAIGLLLAVPTIVTSFIVAYRTHGGSWYHEISLGMSVLLAYPTARLSLVLPAQATDEKMTFRDSWQASSGNGWRLAAVLLAAPLLVEGLRHALSFVPMPKHAALAGARSFVFCMLGVFEIVSLSVSYRLLRAHPSNFELQLTKAP